MKILIPSVSVVAFTALLFPTVGRAASYDCKKAKSFVERKICKVPELSKLDDEMAIQYKESMSKLSEADAEELKASQRLWILQREKCSAVKAAKDKTQDSFKDCLIQSFADRSQALGLKSGETEEPLHSASLTETYTNDELRFKISYPSTMKTIMGTSVTASLSNESWSEFYKLSDPKSKDGTLVLILDTGTRAALRIGYREGNSLEKACSDHSKESSLAANGKGFEKKTVKGQEYFASSFGDAGMQKYLNADHLETYLKDRCLTFERSIRGVNCTVYEEGKERQDCEASESKSKAAYEELKAVMQSIEILK